MRQTLTVKGMAALAPDKCGKRYEIMDTIVPKLGIRVSPAGSKRFIFLSRFPGSSNPTRCKLGDAARMSLADAREIARDWIETLAEGRDPRLACHSLAHNGRGEGDAKCLHHAATLPLPAQVSYVTSLSAVLRPQIKAKGLVQ